jgi:hypothetical protein
MFINEIFVRVVKLTQNKKNSDENPDLPMDFKNLDCKPKV